MADHRKAQSETHSNTTIQWGFSTAASIENRPTVVEDCTRLGDLKADFMMGKAHKSALMVITDRAKLLTRLKKDRTRQDDHTESAFEQMLPRVP